MVKKILKASHRGELKIGDITIACAVLEDGTRVITEGGVYSHLGVQGGKTLRLRDRMEEETGKPVPLFLASKALQPFIDDVFGGEDLAPITYLNNGVETVGYKAGILPKVCEAWLKAKDADSLQKSQLPKAKKAEILMRGLAHIGITALVDEATGYQYERDKLELQKILSAYVSDEIAKWQLTFTSDFYVEMARLWRQPEIAAKKRPIFFGRLTSMYIYEPLHNGVILEEVKKRTPKTTKGNYKYRFHQSLTKDVGREHLKRQITEITLLMKISKTKEEFIRLFKKAYKNQQKELFSDEDE